MEAKGVKLGITSMKDIKHRRSKVMVGIETMFMDPPLPSTTSRNLTVCLVMFHHLHPRLHINHPLLQVKQVIRLCPPGVLQPHRRYLPILLLPHRVVTLLLLGLLLSMNSSIQKGKYKLIRHVPNSPSLPFQVKLMKLVRIAQSDPMEDKINVNEETIVCLFLLLASLP